MTPVCAWCQHEKRCHDPEGECYGEMADPYKDCDCNGYQEPRP